MVVLVKILPLEQAMTLTDTFLTAAGMAPQESAKRLQHTLYWLPSTNKWKFLSHTFLPSVKLKGSCGSHAFYPPLQGTRKSNFCFMNVLWHLFQTEFFRFS